MPEGTCAGCAICIRALSLPDGSAGPGTSLLKIPRDNYVCVRPHFFVNVNQSNAL